MVNTGAAAFFAAALELIFIISTSYKFLSHKLRLTGLSHTRNYNLLCIGDTTYKIGYETLQSI